MLLSLLSISVEMSVYPFHCLYYCELLIFWTMEVCGSEFARYFVHPLKENDSDQSEIQSLGIV